MSSPLEQIRASREPEPIAHLPVAPASRAQTWLWLINQIGESGPNYNVPFIFEIDGHVDHEALRAALHDLVRRHESLRTVFDEVDSLPIQRILDPVDVGLLLEVRAARAAELSSAVAEAVGCCFDLGKEPPIRAWLFQVNLSCHVLVLVVHHIACDGWSTHALIGDLACAYAARLSGVAPDYPPLPLQYADYAIWQNRFLGNPADTDSVLGRQLGYWKQALRGLPDEVLLPWNHPRPASPSYQGAVAVGSLDAAATARLKWAARDSRVSVFMALQAAVAAMLSQQGAGTDIPLGTATAGRLHAALDDVVGFFVNTLVLRTSLAMRPTWRQLLHRVRETDLAAYAHQDVPFDYLVAALSPPRIPGRNPLFQAAITFVDREGPVLSLPGARTRSVALPVTTAIFDLAFAFTQNADRTIAITLEYATDLFTPATINTLIEQLTMLLIDFPAHLDTPVRGVSS